MSRFEQPIIAPWHHGDQVENAVIGAGNLAEVTRRAFQTPEGIAFYAYKPMSNCSEAMRTAEMYTRLRAANLPVVSFLKTMCTKNTGGGLRYGIAMEDMTCMGRYEIVPVDKDSGMMPLVDISREPETLKRRMVQDLAVMHNNGLYDFHPGISFFLRFDLADLQNVAYRILDYSNICYQTTPNGWPDRWAYGDFTDECEGDAKTLIGRLTSDADDYDALSALYWEARQRGDIVAGAAP